MGRVGALAGTGLEQAAVLAGLEHLVQEEPFGPAGGEAAAELGEDGEVESGVVELEAEGVLPVDAAADGVGGLSIGEVLGELHDGDQGEPPGGQCGLSAPGVEVGEVAVAEDGAEFVAEPEVGIPLGEGGAGDAGGQLGDGRDGAGLQGHGGTSGWSARRHSVIYFSIAVCRPAVNSPTVIYATDAAPGMMKMGLSFGSS